MRLIVILALVACGPSAPPRSEPPSARVTTPTPPPPEAPVVERWGCERVLHSLVDYHRATLELRDDATFELHHSHTTPERGWTSWVLGTWSRADQILTLAPVSATRRAWIGDGHRHQHGENVPYDQWEETVTTAAWRLVQAPGQPGLRVDELSTAVYRLTGSDPTPQCDPGPPPHRSRP